MQDYELHKKVVILIPAKNEAQSVGTVIQGIQRCFFGQIVVIDDASQDDTATIARQAGAYVIPLAYSLGAWGATQTGLRYAWQQGYDIAITMDADGQHEPESIPTLLATLAPAYCDVVIGAHPQRGSLARRLAWSLFRWLSGVTLEDLTSGLRGYNKKAIAILASNEATLLDYQDMGVLMLLSQNNLLIEEVPILMYPRSSGHSRIFSSWWAVTHYMVYTLTLCLARSKRIRIRQLPLTPTIFK
ncbi:glycosyltransferase family 2 protein [Beggiatoa leptomitoformis]|uniref:Glycosyltransferase n=1 Tax=Beggiatoa leptomitoformis TaxID=288004 RepID=A0A2N9YHT2_9GAMM|nr:glycosyltransferase family 2 protein [Beggiatoa leptomitoformis]ALG67950.1 glycosyltransferase [Beggiatoa leptomitoformis]AUI69776.1 glycosyltransferase [Beggiatoa leptomitoformis]